MSRSKLLEDLMAELATSKKQTVKQQRIIESAIELFAEKGYANTSTAEIAKLAEVAEGTIFKHYGTKDNLLLSIIVPYLKDFFPAMADEVFKEIMSQEISTFEGFFKALFKNRIEFIQENKEIFQVVIKEIMYKEDLKNELLPHFFANISGRLIKTIELFKDRGELIDLPSERILKMLVTFIGGFFVSRFVLLPNYIISDEEVEDVVQFVMEGIRRHQV